MQAANRVALNATILYARMIATMLIALYSTRIVLNALGSVDYGIFNLIAGVIAMLSFLNTAMTASTQRYLSFYQGKQDTLMQRVVFKNSLFIHIIIALVVCVSLELLGFALFDKFLNIPKSRLETAKTIYHFMSATVFFTVVAVPFTSLLNAKENMATISIVSVVESLLKLATALSLQFAMSDKLLWFGILTASISAVSFVLYSSYCFFKYQECTIIGILSTDKKLIVELTSFAGWNLFGTLCTLSRAQGIAVLLNIFFGTVVNAAYGIANQVSGQFNFFSSTLLQALNPQIMKSEGADDRSRMLKLAMMASKFAFFALTLIVVPCMFEMTAILRVWLKSVPDQTVIFCNLVLASTLVNQLTIGLQSAIQATGKVKLYQAVVGSLILSNLPLAYLFLKFGLPAYFALVSFVFIELIACSLRIYFLKRNTQLKVKDFLVNVLIRDLAIVLISVIVCYSLRTYIESEVRFLYTIAISILIMLPAIYSIGLNTTERHLIISLVQKLSSKLSPRNHTYTRI